MLLLVGCSTSHRVAGLTTSLLRCLQTKHRTYSALPAIYSPLRTHQPRGYRRRNSYCKTTLVSTRSIMASSCCNSEIKTTTDMFSSIDNNSNSNSKHLMHPLNVINVPEDDTLKITFDYSSGGTSRRNFNLLRPKDEPLGQSLSRLKANMYKYVIKKKQRKKKKLKNAGEKAEDDLADEDESIDISVWKEKIQISESVPNKEAWVTGSILQIDSSLYKIIVNTPAIANLNIPTHLMVGFPVYPKIEYLFTDATQCDFSWYRNINRSAVNSGQNSHSNNGKPPEPDNWETLSSSSSNVYTPIIDDLGHTLKVVCVPKNTVRDITGKEVSALSSDVVQSGPGHCPFQERHLYTRELTEVDCFRVVSYNILADLYADSDYSREKLYPYCPPYALSIDYRKQLVLKEIAGYNADLICLQEVDKKIFENFLLPGLSELGFDGVLKTKAGQVPEGCATFFRKSKFKLLSQHDIIITEVIQNDPRFEDILQLLKLNEYLEERILNRQTAFQLTVLESLEKGYLLFAANVHLYFHPTANSVRLLQTAVCMRQIDSVMKMYKDKGKEMTLTFCGDFNSSPDHGVNQFMKTGFIPADFEEWTAEGNLDGVETGIPISHSFRLLNGCGNPEYTNYVGGFNAQLDYIYYDPKQLEVQAVVPNPDHELVTVQSALPSIVFPSDHIAQICTFKWK